MMMVAVNAQMLMMVAAVEIYLLDCSPARASSNQRRPPSPPADCQDALAAPSSGGMDAPAALHSSLRVTEVDLDAAVRVRLCQLQLPSQESHREATERLQRACGQRTERLRKHRGTTQGQGAQRREHREHNTGGTGGTGDTGGRGVYIGCAARSSSCSIQIGCIAVGEIRAALPTWPRQQAFRRHQC